MTNLSNETREIELRRLEAFEASELLGAPFSVMLLHAVDEKRCRSSGAILGHRIHQVSELIEVAAVKRACEPLKLSGGEIRFLRRSLRRNAKEFASDVGMTPETLSRFENDKQPVPINFEKLIRALVCLEHLDVTLSMGAHPDQIRSMKILAAYDVEKPLSIELTFDDTPSTTSIETSGYRVYHENNRKVM